MSEGIFYTLGLRTSAFTGPLASAQSAIGRFQGSLAGMAAKAAALAAPVIGVGAAFAGFRKAITAAADMESTAVAFETLIGSASKAKKTLDELKALGAETPFEFPELADAGRKLIAFGEGADTVGATLRRIGDLASGVQAPIGEIAELFGKARVQGTLFAEDINQLTGRGIPVIQQFANILGVSQGEVKKLASEGKITFPLLEQAFVNLTSQGGQFFNMMAKQSGTTNGLLSTLKDNIGEIFRIIGQPINDFLRPFLTDSIARTQRLGQGLAAFIKLLQAAREGGQLGEFVGNSLVLAAKETINVLTGGFRGGVAYLGTALPAVFSAAADSVFGSRFAIAIESIFRAAGDIISASARDGAASFAEAFGRLGFADDLREFADADRQRAANRMRTAAGALGGARGADVEEAARKILDAHRAGAAAFESAAKDSPIFDTRADRARFAELSRGLDPKAFAELTKAFQGTPLILQKLSREQEGATKAAKDFTAAMKPAAAAAGRAAAGEGPFAGQAAARRRGLANREESRLQQNDRRSERDKARNPLGLRGLRRFDEAGAAAFPVAGLDAINRRGQAAAENVRPGNPRPTKPRELIDGQSRAEQLLAKIESHLAKVEAA
jgi:tape measure domain-containing protein